MLVSSEDLSPRDSYRLLIACVIPRPIAWVSTVDQGDRPNLAPFSFFGGVTSDPPTVMLSVGRRKGARKDTSKNLLATREAVIHVPTRELAEKMVATSADLASGVSEFEAAGLTTTPSECVRPLRVAEAAVAMEAQLRQHVQVGNGPVDLFLMEITHFHIRDDVLVDGLPDPAKLAAVGRLGGAAYCDTANPFDILR